MSGSPNVVIVEVVVTWACSWDCVGKAWRGSVALLDIDPGRWEPVNRGCMPFLEAGGGGNSQASDRKESASDTGFSLPPRSGVVITVVGTPVDEHLNPTCTFL